MPLTEPLILLVLAYATVFAIQRNNEKPHIVKRAVAVKAGNSLPAPKYERQRVAETRLALESGNTPDRDAIEALRALGYSKTEAVLAVRGVQARLGNIGTAGLVKAALQQAIVKAT